MPYIKNKVRELYDPHIDSILGEFKITDKEEVAGTFTYVIYRLLRYFNSRFWMRALGIGCLVCAILEIYRKDHAIYEDQKEEENGSI